MDLHADSGGDMMDERESFESWKRNVILDMERSMLYSMFKDNLVSKTRSDILNIFQFDPDKHKQAEKLLDKLTMETEKSKKFDVAKIANLLKDLTDIEGVAPSRLWIQLIKLRDDMLAWKEHLERENLTFHG